MRDPMRWALTVFRAFGIPVRVHLFFFIITLGLCIRQISVMPHVWWVDVVLVSVVALFFVVLLHEFGHCFGARYVDGEAKEVLIWPLGGLAYVDVPHTPRANFITTAAGPAVNVLISFGMITFIFAVIFRMLPDARIKWSDVWSGAIITALLFTLGKYLIGLYINFSGVGDTYGAAGAVVVILVWVYYSTLIMLYGAHYTHVHTRERSRLLIPYEHAEVVGTPAQPGAITPPPAEAP